MATVNVALKEWAVIARALDRGEQFLVLRKGGIREQKKQFVLERDEFLLYPTYEHQRKELLKPRYHLELDETLACGSGNGTLTISNLARVEEALELTEAEKVDALSPFYICTNDYAQYRLRWRPKKPLSVLLLRVFRLARPRTIPVLERYGGCTSWVDLEETIETDGAWPVLSDDEFGSRLEALHRAIEA